MTRVGLVQVINQQPDMEVSWQAGNPAEAMAELANSSPDLILADLTMKGGSGLDFIKDVTARYAEIPILVVSMHDEMVYAERVLRAGARGYIMKEETGEHLIAAIRRVLGGGVYLSENMSSRIYQSFAGNKATQSHAHLEQLSDREFDIFQLIGRGRTTQEIAVHLRLSPKTVDTHRSNIRQKLGLENGTTLLRYAVQWTASQSSV